MSNQNSSADVRIDVPLVERLIAQQFPRYADLPIKPVANSGWSNRTFHLGDAMSVRLPSAKPYAPAIQMEQYWLPQLGPHLPLPIPIPLGLGAPCAEFPWHWSVYRWLDGDFATDERVSDKSGLATALAEFLLALQRIDASEGPRPGEHAGARGVPVSTLSNAVERAIVDLEQVVDSDVLRAIWRESTASEWLRAPVWVHGDVAAGNILVKNGRLCGVIDFGSLVVGDPACDLVIAWTFLDADSREAFRRALVVDDGTWTRARGWALWKALIVQANHIQTNRMEEAAAVRAVVELVADYKHRS